MFPDEIFPNTVSIHLPMASVTDSALPAHLSNKLSSDTSQKHDIDTNLMLC